MKKAYVASPVAHYFGVYGKDAGLKLAKKHAMMLSKLTKERGYIPISVPLMFLDVLEEPKDRDFALMAGISILKTCDVFCYLERDLPYSAGMQAELEEAESRKMEIIAL